MRKLVEKKDNKKTQKFVVLGGIFLVAIMFFSTIGYSFMSMSRESGGVDSSFEHNGFSFTQNGGYFFTRIGNYDFEIRTDPRDMDDKSIDSPRRTLASYSGTPLYYDSYNALAYREIENNFRQIVLRMNEACPGEILNDSGILTPIIECDLSRNLPIKNCAEYNSIIIVNSDEPGITEIGNCIIISGNDEEILKITDKFILETLGIIS